MLVRWGIFAVRSRGEIWDGKEAYVLEWFAKEEPGEGVLRGVAGTF